MVRGSDWREYRGSSLLPRLMRIDRIRYWLATDDRRPG